MIAHSLLARALAQPLAITYSAILAEKLDIEPRRVQIWFQNKRAKVKRDARKTNGANAPPVDFRSRRVAYVTTRDVAQFKPGCDIVPRTLAPPPPDAASDAGQLPALHFAVASGSYQYHHQQPQPQPQPQQ